MFMWWRDVINEAHRGDHTPVVQLHLRYGMLLFIASEVMFFVAWFWAFFDASAVSRRSDPGRADAGDRRAMAAQGHHRRLRSLAPAAAQHADPADLGHDGDLGASRAAQQRPPGLIWGLALTVVLGMLFTAVQAYEYAHAAFAFSREHGGNIYGSTFFMATGFHGFHVIVGTIFLLVCLFRAMQGHFTPQQHFGFEAAAWYWHFVDVVWLFLFACIYVWGSPAAARNGRPLTMAPAAQRGSAGLAAVHWRCTADRSWRLAAERLEWKTALINESAAPRSPRRRKPSQRCLPRIDAGQRVDYRPVTLSGRFR